MSDIPDILRQFQALDGDLTKFRGLMERALRSDIDETTRRHLEMLGKAFDGSLSQLKQQLPEAVQQLAKKEGDVRASIDRTMARGDELKRQAEAATSKVESIPTLTPPPAPKPTSAELEAKVRRYRQELLALLGDEESPGDEPRTGGKDREIWEDLSKLEGQ